MDHLDILLLLDQLLELIELLLELLLVVVNVLVELPLSFEEHEAEELLDPGHHLLGLHPEVILVSLNRLLVVAIHLQ